MFENIHNLRKRSNQFVANLPVFVAEAIEGSKELVDINQSQLQQSKTAKGQSITPLYSTAYARKKGYNKPDGFLTGQMYREMFVDANENNNTFQITSFAPHTNHFAGRYGEVFGIAPSNTKKAQGYVIPRLRQKYINFVLV